MLWFPNQFGTPMKIAALLLIVLAMPAWGDDGFFTRTFVTNCAIDRVTGREVCRRDNPPPILPPPSCSPIIEVLACRNGQCSCLPAAQCRMTIDWASNDALHPTINSVNPAIPCEMTEYDVWASVRY